MKYSRATFFASILSARRGVSYVIQIFRVYVNFGLLSCFRREKIEETREGHKRVSCCRRALKWRRVFPILMHAFHILASEETLKKSFFAKARSCLRVQTKTSRDKRRRKRRMLCTRACKMGTCGGILSPCVVLHFSSTSLNQTERHCPHK